MISWQNSVKAYVPGEHTSVRF